MRVLWVGDAVVSSGFARCTHAACDELHAAGHEVHVLGLNYFGDPHDHPYEVFPCYQPLDGGRDVFGVHRLPRLVAKLKPDVVVLLNDPWNVPAYMDSLRQAVGKGWFKGLPPVVGWIAVDGKNQRGAPLNELALVVAWARFAVEELRAGGYTGPAEVVPLGVDPHFFPRDRALSRARVTPAGLDPGAFLVGVVGRNQLRKRLDLTLEYFAEWIRSCRVDDAYLYLHVAPTGDGGYDLRSLTKYHGLAGRVILAEPHIGRGEAEEHMAAVYSALDVYWTTTQGEGWGLPCLEAMACGVPCLVPDWSALGDWTRDAAVKVPCTSTAVTAPINDLAYTVGGVPDRTMTVRALHGLYKDAALRAEMSARGLGLAAQLPWGNAGRRVRELLEGVVAGQGVAA